jgi:hypothetical protein
MSRDSGSIILSRLRVCDAESRSYRLAGSWCGVRVWDIYIRELLSRDLGFRGFESGSSIRLWSAYHATVTVHKRFFSPRLIAGNGHALVAFAAGLHAGWLKFASLERALAGFKTRNNVHVTGALGVGSTVR